jgi:hypothetical protein
MSLRSRLHRCREFFRIFKMLKNRDKFPKDEFMRDLEEVDRAVGYICPPDTDPNRKKYDSKIE